jgi:hypothetical protein
LWTTTSLRRLDASLAKLMPVVRRELERLRANAENVRPAFEEIPRRAWAVDLDYDRYLQRS